MQTLASCARNVGNVTLRVSTVSMLASSDLRDRKLRLRMRNRRQSSGLPPAHSFVDDVLPLRR